MSSIPSSAAATTPVPVRIASIVGFLVFTELASGITQGWIAPLLPSFIERYGLTSADANWIVASALLATVVLVPLLSKLGDVYGHKRLLLVAAVLVALGSVIVAVAPSFALLLVGRVLQGAVTAFLPLEFAIVRERADDRAGRAIGLLVGSLTVGASLGLLLAGVARQYLSLPATLWLPAIMMLIIAPMLARLVPETIVRKPGGVDWPGAALLGIGLLLFLAAVGNGTRLGWLNPWIVGGMLGGAVLLVAWVYVESRIEHPLVPLEVIRRGGQGLPLLTAFVFGAHLFGVSAPTAVFLGTRPGVAGLGMGLAGTALGGALLVLGVAMFVGTTIAARLADLIGETATLVAGALLSAVCYLAAAAFHHDLAVFLIWQAGLGLGGGLVGATLPTIIVTRAPADSVGIVSGLYNTARTAAGSVAGAMFAAVMSALVLTRHRPGGGTTTVSAESAYVVVWLICAGLALLVAILAIGVTRRGHRIVEQA
ncbi:MFS transporter [Nocardia sp. CA2R105]|uniref:MFS transporter n=1 Tax=Nocardia coffeae TaxID=2873381 RepID=UPI001CA7175C|nr:MFS transporter [Nocardia coffeae]MBY8861292.1 MFS transporter [Nocardia coffeae]